MAVAPSPADRAPMRFEVLTFRDGKIVHIEDFNRRRKALRAAGLRD